MFLWYDFRRPTHEKCWDDVHPTKQCESWVLRSYWCQWNFLFKQLWICQDFCSWHFMTFQWKHSRLKFFIFYCIHWIIIRYLDKDYHQTSLKRNPSNSICFFHDAHSNFQVSISLIQEQISRLVHFFFFSSFNQFVVYVSV